MNRFAEAADNANCVLRQRKRRRGCAIRDVVLPPTGRPVTRTGQEIFRFDGEQFVEAWHQEDVPGMLEQLGLQRPLIVIRLAARQSAWRYRRAQDR